MNLDSRHRRDHLSNASLTSIPSDGRPVAFLSEKLEKRFKKKSVSTVAAKRSATLHA